MKVILKKDFDELGAEGEIKEVKDGYARNFLIPNGIAMLASESNIKSFEEIKKQRRRKILKEIEDSKKLSEILEKENLVIAVKSGEDGKIYGSVTAQMIFDELTAKGYGHIDRKKIILKEHIKNLGEHTVTIKLHSNVIASLKVTVVSDNQQVTIDEKTVGQTTDENTVEQTTENQE